MRWLACFVLGACAFDHGKVSATTDAAMPDAIDAPQPRDAAGGPACGGKVWLADFTTDPTTLDLNGDGMPDFAMRDAQPLGGTLASGVWSESMPRPLDSQPKQPFLTRTVVHVRMRNTVMPAPGGLGAIFWINVDYDGTNFAPLYINAALQSGNTQTATLVGKSGPSAAYVIAQVSFLDTGMHDYYLDIAPTQHVVDFKVDALDMPGKSFTAFAANGNTDEWASLDAATASDFDELSVEVCP